MTIGPCTLEAADGFGIFLGPLSVLRYGPVGALVDESHKTPKRLDEGESHTFLFPVETLREGLREHTTIGIWQALVQDGTGKEWRCRLKKTLLTYLRGDGK